MIFLVFIIIPIIELASVYKRLREFENKIEKNIKDEKTGIVR